MWILIALAACTGEADSDDTSPGGNDTDPSADAPEVPTARSGEGVVVIRDAGQDTTFTCAAGGSGVGLWWEIPADYPIDGFTLELGCGASLAESVTLKAYLDDRAPGAWALTSVPTSGQDQFIDELDVNLFPDGENGFRVNGGMSFVGTLTLDQAGGDGQFGVGTLVASWTSVFPIANGEVALESEERPGGLAMAFDFPFSGP